MGAAAVKHTVEDIWALPEGERAELIDGMWYDMASPSGRHQWIVMEVAAEFRDYIRKKGGKCKVFPAPFAVYLNDDNRTYLEPDISVLCDMSKYTEDGIYGAPDLVVEVVSPSSRKKDYGLKQFKYQNAGVKEYWIIDPEEETLNVYWFAGEPAFADEYAFDEKVPSHLYPGLELCLKDIMDALQA